MTFLIIFHVLSLAFYLSVQHFFEQSKPLYKWYYGLFGLKVMAGLYMGLLYTFYYKSGDITYTYAAIARMSTLFYADFHKFISMYLAQDWTFDQEPLLQTIFNVPRQWFLVKVLTPIGIVINNFWMLNVYVSIFAFYGLWNLSNRIVSLFPVSKTAVVLAFLVYPSVVFWSSGIMKEAILLGCIGFCMSFYLKWMYEKKRPELIELFIFIVCLWLVWNIKYYVFAVLFLILVAHALHRISMWIFPVLKEYKKSRVAAYFTLLLLLLFSAGWIHPNLSVQHLYTVVYDNYVTTHLLSNGHDVFHLNWFYEQSIWMFLDVPKALFFGLFGPLYGTNMNVMFYVNVLENIFLLTLTALFLQFQIKNKWRNWSLEDMMVVSYIVFMALFMAFSTPNWGTLVRYKVAYLPLYVLLITANHPLFKRLDLYFFPEPIQEHDNLV